MQKRYIAKPPRAMDDFDWWEDRPLMDQITVYEPADTYHSTGLLDKRGNELFAVTTAQPIGFVRRGK